MFEILSLFFIIGVDRFSCSPGNCHTPDITRIPCDVDLTPGGVLLVQCRIPGDVTYTVIACDAAMFVNGFLSKTFAFFNVSASREILRNSGQILSCSREVYPTERGEYVFEVSITFRSQSNCKENATGNAVLKVRTDSITITNVPTISVKPQDDISLCTENRMIIFQCTANWFFVPPRIRWFVGGIDVTKTHPGTTTILSKSTAPYYEVISTIYLKLASPDNQSVIQCQNADPPDPTQWGNPLLYDTLKLNILSIPKIGPPILNVNSSVYDAPSHKLFEGESVTFGCSIQGQDQGVTVVFSCYDENQKSHLVRMTSETGIIFTLVGNKTYHRATCVCTGQHPSGCYELKRKVTLLLVAEMYAPVLTQDECPRLRPVYKNDYGVTLGVNHRVEEGNNLSLECTAGSKSGQQVTSVSVSCENLSGAIWLTAKNKSSSVNFTHPSTAAVDRSVCTCAVYYLNDFCVATSYVVIHVLKTSPVTVPGLIQISLHYLILGAISCFLLPLIIGLFVYIAKNWSRLYAYYYYYGNKKHEYEQVQATSITSLEPETGSSNDLHIYSEVRETPMF